MRRFPRSMIVIALLLGAMVTGLFFADHAPPSTAILWGLASAALVLVFTKRRRYEAGRTAPGKSGDGFGPVEGNTSPG